MISRNQKSKPMERKQHKYDWKTKQSLSNSVFFWRNLKYPWADNIRQKNIILVFQIYKSGRILLVRAIKCLKMMVGFWCMKTILPKRPFCLKWKTITLKEFLVQMRNEAIFDWKARNVFSKINLLCNHFSIRKKWLLEGLIRLSLVFPSLST